MGKEIDRDEWFVNHCPTNFSLSMPEVCRIRKLKFAGLGEDRGEVYDVEEIVVFREFTLCFGHRTRLYAGHKDDPDPAIHGL